MSRPTVIIRNAKWKSITACRRYPRSGEPYGGDHGCKLGFLLAKNHQSPGVVRYDGCELSGNYRLRNTPRLHGPCALAGFMRKLADDSTCRSVDQVPIIRSQMVDALNAAVAAFSTGSGIGARCPRLPGARHLAESKIWQAHQDQRDATTVTQTKPSVIASGVPLFDQAAAAHDGQGMRRSRGRGSFYRRFGWLTPQK